MFAHEVQGQQTYRRSDDALYPPYLPTDQQAEVLVANPVPLQQIQAVIVPSREQAATEVARLRLVSRRAKELSFSVSPDMFDKYKLSGLLKRGIRPKENPVDATRGAGRAE